MITKNNILPVVVLIAEDQETDAFFIERAFGESKVENEFYWVKDGQEVMDFLNREGGHKDAPRPDIVFLDIKMPRMDGHEALMAIKSDDAFKSIPTIIMSGSEAMYDVVRSYESGANAYVSKSNGFEDMLSFVDSVERFWFSKARLPQQRA